MVFWISMTDPPEIEIERSWIHTGLHQESLLTCFVHAEPPANVSSVLSSSNQLLTITS